MVIKSLTFRQLYFYYVGAAMSLKSVFSTPFQERLAAYNSKLTWADSSCSDCVSFLNAYRVCIVFDKKSEGANEIEVCAMFNSELELVGSCSYY
jgi:hypothetical protein